MAIVGHVRKRGVFAQQSVMIAASKKPDSESPKQPINAIPLAPDISEGQSSARRREERGNQAMKKNDIHDHSSGLLSPADSSRRRIVAAGALSLAAPLYPASFAQAAASSGNASSIANLKGLSSSEKREIALRDMRASGGGYARNDDRLLQRGSASQADRAGLVMGRYGTPAAFTHTNPDYRHELYWVGSSDRARSLKAWTRLVPWDQVYLSERYGAGHASGYRGNSRVRTWGHELWIKRKSGAWTRIAAADNKGAEAWRPTFRGSPSYASSALDLRKEPDGSTSVRPLPARGLDSSGSYWVPHGFVAVREVNPHDVADILVCCYSQLVLHNTRSTDDRRYARFLLGVGADWYPPSGTRGWTTYPGVGTSRHKYVTVEPSLHVMHTMTESEFRSNPPPL